MKCIVILTDMNMGGVTTAAVNFCNGLVDRGYSVDVLVMSGCTDEDKVRFDSRISFLRLKGLPKLWNLGISTVRQQTNYFKKACYCILGIIKKILNKKSLWNRFVFGKKVMFSGYDVVFAYRQCAPCYYFALNCVDANRKMAFVHGDLRFMGDISTWQKYMKHFDAVAYVSRAVKDIFVEAYPELRKNAVTVYNTFDTNEIQEKAYLQSSLIFDRSVINLVSVSRIENVLKGTGRIVPVCNMLKSRYAGQFHWYVVGGGPDLDACIQDAKRLGVSDHLTFLGPTNNPYNLLVQADCCVLTSFTEAYPMVVGESLILGIPVITTRYPAVEEILKDGDTGLIAEQDIDSIYNRIVQFITDHSLMEQMRANCSTFTYDNDRSYSQMMEALYS